MNVITLFTYLVIDFVNKYIVTIVFDIIEKYCRFIIIFDQSMCIAGYVSVLTTKDRFPVPRQILKESPETTTFMTQIIKCHMDLGVTLRRRFVDF